MLLWEEYTPYIYMCGCILLCVVYIHLVKVVRGFGVVFIVFVLREKNLSHFIAWVRCLLCCWKKNPLNFIILVKYFYTEEDKTIAIYGVA